MKIIKLIEGNKCNYNIDNNLLHYGNVGFVGVYIQKEEDGNISSFCSFPKNYKEIKDKEFNKHIKYVMMSILKSNRCMEDVSNQDNLKGSSILDDINELVEEYYRNGLYYNHNKKYKNGVSGNIYFNKTINKKIPKIVNNNLIYDEFIISKKYTEDNLITDCMAYVIKEGTKLFKFFFDNEVDTEYNIDYSLFENIDYLIEQLEAIKSHTFKDRDLHIINCIINYFTHSKASSGILKICTTNYNLVWQDMIQDMLGNTYKQEHKEPIGLPSNSNKEVKIYLDHYNKDEKIIYDSKYYKEELTHSYKELFYVYHMAMINIKENNITSYDEVIKEKSKWKLRMVAARQQDYEVGNEHIKLLDRTKYDGFIQEVIYLDVYEVICNYIHQNKINLIDSIMINTDNLNLKGELCQGL